MGIINILFLRLYKYFTTFKHNILLMIDKYRNKVEEKGVSPVIGVILLVAVTVALVALATVIVFDLGDDVSNTADVTLDVSETSDGVDITVLRNENVEELRVIDPDGEDESFDSSVGSTVHVQGEAGSYNIIAVLADGSEESIRTITISEDSATEGESVTGTVNVNPAIEGATVEAYENGELVDSDITNADGEYTLTVSDREQAEIIVSVERFEYEDSDGNDVILSASGNADASGDTDFDFDADTGEEVTINGETITVVNQVEDGVTQIGNVDQLQAINEDISGDYKLIRDIDASDTENWNYNSTTDSYEGFDSISDDDEFTGSLDGQGYEVSGLYIERPAENFVGLIGSNEGTVENIGVVNADVTGDETVGGLVGENVFGDISESYATGDVTGEYRVGGLVGANDGEVSESYATGDVTGDDFVGGLVGENVFGDISESYATGDVTGEDTVGGLVGSNGGIVSESYATGSVTGDDWVGGLVGDNLDTVIESYWDTETSGKDVSDGGTGLNTVDMQGDSAEDNMFGFDFADTWVTVEGEYPKFQ